MQAMYELVGDKIQEIFDAQVVDIGIYDRAAGLVLSPTRSSAASGSPTSRSRSSGSGAHVIETRSRSWSSRIVARGDRARPAVRYPGEPSKSVVRADHGRWDGDGVSCSQNLDREQRLH